MEVEQAAYDQQGESGLQKALDQIYPSQPAPDPTPAPDSLPAPNPVGTRQ